MSRLISYAQNSEDIVLHRALQHVAAGFYIDIGAYDPSYDSVTKLFYERGWSGINIEPTTAMYDRLVLDRPRDQNLNIALSDENGELTFYQVRQTGLSTLDASAADKARSEGFPVEEARTEVRTLADVCRTSQVGDIHFLKIDVEGAERQVLLGADFAAFRPWIVVVEATRPGTSERVDDQWRSLLEDAGYEQILFDGLNLFFLSSEHPELRPLLLAPANVIDRFIPVQHHAALLRLGSLSADAKDEEQSLANGSPEPLRELIAWHSAVAREGVERESAERIAWNRADAEALLRRSMEDTIAWHRADAAERAFRRGTETSDFRLREAIEREVEARKVAEEGMAALRRLRVDQAANYAAAEAEFNAVRTQHDIDVAARDRAYRELLIRDEAVRNSMSWRLTRPLRVLRRFLKSGLSSLKR